MNQPFSDDYILPIKTLMISGMDFGLPTGRIADFIALLGLVFIIFSTVSAQLRHLWQRTPRMVRRILTQKALVHINAAFDDMKNLQQGFDGLDFSPQKIQRFIHILDSCQKHLIDVQDDPSNRLLDLVLNCESCMEDLLGLRTDLHSLLEETGQVILFPKNHFHLEAAHIIEQLSQIQFTAKHIGNVKE